MSSARSVAKELVRLSMSGPLPDPPTYYRLQCLLYYAQAWSLVLRDSELFPDDIKALTAGPVVPDILALQGDGPVWYVIQIKTFEHEPDLDQEDESLFLRHLWVSYSSLSNSGLHSSVQEEPPFLKAKKEKEACGVGLIDMSELRESFARRLGIPGPLNMYRQMRQQREREAELAILSGAPLDVDAIWKGCRSVTPSASRK